MPTYEYVCRSCGHLFEIVQSMRDDTLTECPQCGGELRKVFAPPAISFKGSGFYATDHGKKKSKPAGDKKADAGSGSGSGSGSESGSGSGSGSGSSDTTSDAKPAAETKTDAPPSTSAPAKDASGS